MANDPEGEPWRQYFEEFRKRATRVPSDAFDRATLLYEAAHDTYETTTNRLTASGWDAEQALVLGKTFGAVVKEWVDKGVGDMADLEARLRSRYATPEDF